MLAENLERREYTIELKSFTSILELLGVLCVKWRLPVTCNLPKYIDVYERKSCKYVQVDDIARAY